MARMNITAIIAFMNNDERDLNPQSGAAVPDDDLRYAPPVPPAAEPVAAAPEMSDDTAAPAMTDDAAPDETPLDDLYVSDAPVAVDSTEALDAAPSVAVTPDSLPVNVTDGLDIAAALAAVSTLSDMVAEQEAAEQLRQSQAEAREQARVEAQTRLEHPEQFFPVPPVMTLKRGQLSSVIPALLLIAAGVWLTFNLTTGQGLPNAGWLLGLGGGALGLMLLGRWLASGRWARGALFFGLALLLVSSLFIAFTQFNLLALAQGWPLLVSAIGLAAMLTSGLAQPRDGRLLLPGLTLLVGGVAGLVVTLNLLDAAILSTAATAWPLALVGLVIIWLLPLIVRR